MTYGKKVARPAFRFSIWRRSSKFDKLSRSNNTISIYYTLIIGISSLSKSIFAIFRCSHYKTITFKNRVDNTILPERTLETQRVLFSSIFSP